MDTISDRTKYSTPRLKELEKLAVIWAEKCLKAYELKKDLIFEEEREILYGIINEMVDITKGILPYWIGKVPEVRKLKSNYDKRVIRQIEKGYEYALSHENILSIDFDKFFKRIDELEKWLDRPESERELWFIDGKDVAKKVVVRRPI